MIDTINFSAPLGPLGWLGERLVLRRYLKQLSKGRAEAIRIEAEASTP